MKNIYKQSRYFSFIIRFIFNFLSEKFNFEALLEEIHSWTYLSIQYAYWPYWLVKNQKGSNTKKPDYEKNKKTA